MPEIVEVPVLVDPAGHAWALPACAPVPGSEMGAGPALLETASLTPDAADRASAEAVAAVLATGRGPGAHSVRATFDRESGRYRGAMLADPPLDGWALAEELLGIDLAAAAPRPGSALALPAELPTSTPGHAIEARISALAAPEGARVLHVRLPRGPGIRVVAPADPGQLVAEAPIVRVIAHGRDRATAMARLHQALLDSAFVVEGSSTNRCALLAAVAAQMAGGPAADKMGAPTSVAPDPVAVLVSAVRASDDQRAVDQTAFHARAQRGRPEPVRASGVAVALVHGGQRYRLDVFRTGPSTYRLVIDQQLAEVAVERTNEYEWTVTCGGHSHHVVVSQQGGHCHLEVDGVAQEVQQDEGVLVRAGWPALIVSVATAEGRPVAQGDPLVVVEAMKMESTIRAPFAGVVTAVEVLPNEQVDAGTPLVRIRPPVAQTPSAQAAEAARVDFARMALADTSGRPPSARVYQALSSYLLGYEMDPASLAALLGEQRSFASRASAADADLLAAEDAFLDLFTDLGLLWQPGRVAGATATSSNQVSAREYLFAYLQWLDPDRSGLPDSTRRRLSKVMARYRITDLRRSPELEQAVVLLFNSRTRLQELARVVTGILERRLRFRGRIQPLVDSATARARYDRLTAATQGHLESIADLARDARFRFVDEQLLESGQAKVQQQMEVHLDALAEDPHRPDREELVARLVACPQPLREVLLRRRLTNPGRDMQEVLLEVRARRWYRIRDLRHIRFVEHDGILLCCADYDFEHRLIHVVLVSAPFASILEVGRAIAAHMEGVDPVRAPVVDLMTWRPESQPNGDDLAAQVQGLVSQWDLGRRIWRLDAIVSSLAADADPEQRTQYFTFRGSDEAALAEDRFYRNLHPMLAKRLELWRLANFDLSRLPSPEDVYLFHGVARENPRDHRLFALAEVRDLTAVPSGRDGVPTYPGLERMGLQAIIAMRGARASFPARGRPQANRITLFVRPPWDIPADRWAGMVELLKPLAEGAGLEMVVIRTAIPEPDGTLRPTVLNVDGFIGRSITISEEPPRDDPVRPLTPYRQKVLTAQRFGVPYPFELLKMFAPEPGTLGTFQPAQFIEHDLDVTGERLIPVDRDPGRNKANLVVGLLTTYTEAYPEGMTRVAMLSDPTRGLGNLAEPECRLVNASLDLAEQMGVPVEWFAVSSGALISMDSGTENMDWISATLRRIIEFTQGGGEINIVVTGINVGGQPYWNAEATMLMHTRGILVMTPTSAMVLTGKQALDFSGGVSADDNFGIGGFDRVMGPNGQAQYWAPSLTAACELLLRHYEHTYVKPGERYPRRIPTTDPRDRDVRSFPHAAIPDCDFTVVGDIFSSESNPERKKPFDVRSVMRAVTDADSEPLERWQRWRGGENSVVWDARIGGISVCLLGLESRPLPRRGYVPADGPPSWTSGTLFPQASRKTARAVNAASGNRPLVVLANLSGFDGSPESMRHWQLEYGAEIGRAVTNFRGPIVFVVISRYHGGAFVVFSKALNPRLEVAAVEGSFASVIGGAPAAATVFAREVRTRVEADPRVVAARAQLAGASGSQARERRARLAEITEQVRSEKLGEAAAEFDAVHTIDRALKTGSVDRIIPAATLRPYVIDALERGIALAEG
ncbi:MAG: carboxyl transferase domain-containing protein [Candidatus Nanopelagicales bacterium]